MYRGIKIAYEQISDRLGRVNRMIWRNKYERRRYKNHNITVFSQNCIGGIMCHDLQLQFNSPTVNMLFEPKGFLKFMKNPEYYLDCPIRFVESNTVYPIGSIGDISIRFLHYHSKEEVVSAWNRRKKRINWNNVFVITCDEGLTIDDMKAFDNLPYKNKILFMSKPNQEIKCGIYCKEFKKQTDARLLNFANPLGRRYYQKYIDYVSWLNGEEAFRL